MPLPSPNDKEKRSDFISRCVTDLSGKEEFEGNEQRVAVCISQFEKTSKKASVAVGNEFLDGRGPWNDQDLFYLYNTPKTKMSEASYNDKKKSMSKKMDEKEVKVFKSYMSHCVRNDADMTDTKDMNMDNTMKACAVQYDKDRPMLMKNSNGELNEKQKKLPPALQKAILDKMKKEGKAHHYGDKEESKAGYGGGDEKKKKMEAADDPMAHAYPTKEGAMKEAKKLGLEGIHSHKGKDGKTVYMPGKNHEQFMKKHNEIMKEKKDKIESSLWENIRKKRERIKSGSGEKMRKKGDKGSPTSDQIKKAQK